MVKSLKTSTSRSRHPVLSLNYNIIINPNFRLLEALVCGGYVAATPAFDHNTIPMNTAVQTTPGTPNKLTAATRFQFSTLLFAIVNVQKLYILCKLLYICSKATV